MYTVKKWVNLNLTMEITKHRTWSWKNSNCMKNTKKVAELGKALTHNQKGSVVVDFKCTQC